MSAIEEFLAQKSVAVIGVSTTGTKYSNRGYNKLKSRGYRTYPVNRTAEFIGEDRCYPNLAALPESVDAILLFIPPAETEKVVREALSMGIRHIWMQPGAESEVAIRLCEEQGIEAIYNQCILLV